MDYRENKETSQEVISRACMKMLAVKLEKNRKSKTYLGCKINENLCCFRFGLKEGKVSGMNQITGLQMDKCCYHLLIGGQ